MRVCLLPLQLISADLEPPPGAASCSGRHAANAAVDTAVPRLAGREAADIAGLMRAFKTGHSLPQ